MSLENLKRANEFIRELKKQREEKGPKLKEVLNRQIEGSPVKNRRPPRDYKDSSYLYIRSYDSDNGSRPGLNVAYWRSPDVNVSPLASLNSYTTELNVGTVYNIKCLVHNRGDFIVPSAKVEFYLVTPSLGFDTRFAKKLGVEATWVNCYSSAEVNLHYLIPPSDAGHRCLFARVFSFSPLDIPVHDTVLNPYIDRHIGQKNLNIAAQASQMQINIMHMPQAQLRVNFVPLDREAILSLRHPSAADFKIVDNDKIAMMLSKFKIDFAEKVDGKMRFREGVSHFEFNSEGKFNLDEQKRIYTEMQKVFKRINSGKAKTSQFKEQLAEFRKMHLENSMTPLDLQIPDLGLGKGEMTGFDIVARNNLTGEVFGGITLLVIG
ncbi:MAG TPA: hypothetical protein VFD35_07990 [Pricia sp.]|nr:hypothetical protein [Pricia sp.]